MDERNISLRSNLFTRALEQGCQIFRPKIPIWVNFEGLEMENVDVGHLEHVTAIWSI
jgi:hypothetical protein